MKDEEKMKNNKGKLKYIGVVVVLAFLAGVYLASATTVISDLQMIVGSVTVGPDEIRVGNTVITDGDVGIGTTSPTAKLDVNGNLRVRGDITVDGSAEGGGIPPGVIVMWSGVGATIPSGWALCDGTRGTPDLRDKFIVGAGSSYGVGSTGGDTTHTHGAGSYSVPDHTHTISTHIGSSVYRGKSQYLGVTRDHGDSFGNDYEKNRYGTPDDTLTTSSAGGSPVTGTSASASSLPPYYALAYIMKL